MVNLVNSIHPWTQSSVADGFRSDSPVFRTVFYDEKLLVVTRCGELSRSFVELPIEALVSHRQGLRGITTC